MRTIVILLTLTGFCGYGQDTAGAPVILNVSPSAAAGDVIYIQGSGLGNSPRLEYSFNDSNWAAVPVMTSGNETIMAQLPASQTRLPDLITVRVSPDGHHWSAPVFVNQAKPLSFDTAQIGSGNRFRIFGRNLRLSGTPTVRLIDNAGGSSHPATVDVGKSSSYVLSVVASAGIQPGHTYAVYVGNGHNGNAKRGGEVIAARTLRGRSAAPDYWGLGVPWAADLNFTSNVYNVRTDPRLAQHANGSASDINAIQQAIQRAFNDGGGIVYLPAGTYNLYYSNACGMTLLPRVVVMGAGASKTFVNYGFGPAPTRDQGGYAVCLAYSQTGASDITFTNVNQSGNWPQSATALNVSEVFLQRTIWNIGTSQWLTFQHVNEATIQNSSITQGLDPSYNGPLSLYQSTNFVVRNNTIKYVAGALYFDSVTDGVFENNNVIRDASQSAPAGVITHVLTASFTTNFTVLHNVFSVSGGTLRTQNDGETIATEAGGAIRRNEFRGSVTGWGTNAIIDANQNFNWSSNNAVPNLQLGAIIAIVGGRGAGQWASVTDISPDGHTVFVNKPWVVLPEYGSTYATFSWSAANWIVADNKLSDNEKGIEFFNSSIRDILITNNHLTNNGEILISPTEQPNGAGIFNLVLSTQILNNTLVDTNRLRPAAISAVSREDYQNKSFGHSIIGLEVRGNSISAPSPNTFLKQTWLDDSKALSEGFNLYWQWQTTWSNFIDDGKPSILGSVFQNNTLNDSVVGVHMNSGVAQTVLADNQLNRVGTAVVDLALPGLSHGSVGTVRISGPAKTDPGPPVWNQLTVGSLPTSSMVPQPASVTAFHLPSSAYNIGSGPDALSMLARKVPHDVTASAKISIPASASSATQAQVVFRASADPLSGFVSFGQLEDGRLTFQWRTWQGSGIGGYTLAHAQAPVWVKLVKGGNDFEAQFSDDGVNWQYGGIIGALIGDSNFYVGLDNLSASTNGPAVNFSGVTVQ